MANKIYKIDWEKIEKEYSKGIRSNLCIAKEFGISEAAIRKKAKLHYWSKDLSSRINAMAEKKIQRTKGPFEKKCERESDMALIEAESEVMVRIRLSHRTDIASRRNLCNRLYDEITTSTDEDSLPLPQRVDAFVKLTNAFKMLVALEREAFGIASVIDADPGSNIPLRVIFHAP